MPHVRWEGGPAGFQPVTCEGGMCSPTRVHAMAPRVVKRGFGGYMGTGVNTEYTGPARTALPKPSL